MSIYACTTIRKCQLSFMLPGTMLPAMGNETPRCFIKKEKGRLVMWRGARSARHLAYAASGLQVVLRLHGCMRIVGPSLPALPLVLDRLAQRRERLLVPPLLRTKHHAQNPIYIFITDYYRVVLGF